MTVSRVSLIKALNLISRSFVVLSNVTVLSDKHSAKAFVPINLTLAGNVMDSRPLWLNVKSLISVMFSESLALFKEEQYEKAPFPITVTVSGM